VIGYCKDIITMNSISLRRVILHSRIGNLPNTRTASTLCNNFQTFSSSTSHEQKESSSSKEISFQRNSNTLNAINKSRNCASFHTTTFIQQSSSVSKKVNEVYPGAVKAADLATLVRKVLAENGYDDSKTLLCTSLCCDEVNRELERDFTHIYSYNFNMGGLAGFPFGGVTSFGAMAHHIPDDGSCLVVYGPHVGIDLDGNVGTLNRRGRDGSGSCCGSANAAYGYVKSVQAGTAPNSAPEDALDAQQTFVGNMLLPQASRLSAAADADVELPLALFDVQDEFMKKIVHAAGGEVAGNGKIALLGGIQINTPEGTSEYFLPKVFEIRSNKGDLVADLMKSF